ncbi:hypothetical protein LUU34_01316700 [Aix galericulata]|nr:hypothetical protein LUU34_01316700 [Aix galericulata]
MTEAHCLLCFLARDPSPPCSTAAFPQGWLPAPVPRGWAEPGAVWLPAAPGRRRGAGCWLSVPPDRGTPACSQPDVLLGFMADRWFPSQCLRPTPPQPQVRPAGGAGAPHTLQQPRSSPRARQGRGGGPPGCQAAAPSPSSSNTGLSKQPSLKTLTAAPPGAVLEPGPVLGTAPARSLMARAEETGPSGVVPSPGPQSWPPVEAPTLAEQAQGKGDVGGSSPGGLALL